MWGLNSMAIEIAATKGTKSTCVDFPLNYQQVWKPALYSEHSGFLSAVQRFNTFGRYASAQRHARSFGWFTRWRVRTFNLLSGWINSGNDKMVRKDFEAFQYDRNLMVR
jgi:hypothetical protein